MFDWLFPVRLPPEPPPIWVGLPDPAYVMGIERNISCPICSHAAKLQSIDGNFRVYHCGKHRTALWKDGDILNSK